MTESDVVELRDMATIVRDRVQYMIRKDMTLEQVKAAAPTADYDPVYGSRSAVADGPFHRDCLRGSEETWNGSEPAAKSGLNFIDGGR